MWTVVGTYLDLQCDLRYELSLDACIILWIFIFELYKMAELLLTSYRHLLSDQTDPFNRSLLTMDMIKPNDELRLRIEAWIKERKQHKTQDAQ